MFEDEYEIVNKIHESDIMCVFTARKKESQEIFFAKKFFFTNDRDEDRIIEDVLNDAFLVLKDINHPNIIELIDFKKEFKDNTRNYYCIYRYYNGGNVEDYLKNKNKSFTEEEVQHIMKQLVEAVKYLHNKKIVHRDIKPRSLLIQYDSEEDLLEKNILKAKIKLSNFGASSHLKRGEVLDTIIGTRDYIAPEIKQCSSYNEKVDIWSLGATFCELLSCKINFNILKRDKYPKGQYFPNLSKEANSFIQCMLQYNPEKRKSADELSKHDFLIKNVKNFTFEN